VRPSALEDLVDRFARFRSEHPRGTRIPADLRAGALALLDGGIAPADLHRTCGVSWSQVVAWRAADQTVSAIVRTSEGGEKNADARVFSVIDECSEGHADSAATSGSALELRVGPWSVSVRLADPAQGR
jgi:hypothetical protein